MEIKQTKPKDKEKELETLKDTIKKYKKIIKKKYKYFQNRIKEEKNGFK